MRANKPEGLYPNARIRSKFFSSPTTHRMSPACRQREGVMSVRFFWPSSTPTTIQLYSSRIPLSLSVFPMKGLVLEMVKLRSFISCFSMLVTSGCNSAFIALESFVSCSSLPMACSLSPGKRIVPPFGILICLEPRRILLICTPKRFRSFKLCNVLPAKASRQAVQDWQYEYHDQSGDWQIVASSFLVFVPRCHGFEGSE